MTAPRRRGRGWSLALLGACLLLAGANPEAPPTLLAFAALPDADESALLRFAIDGSAREIARLSHAAGFLPRGAVARDGLVAAVVVPEGGDLRAPAELVTVDAGGTIRLLDDAARALHRPLFLADGTLLSLRGAPGRERRGEDGRALLTTEITTVMAWSKGAPRVVLSHEGLWLDLIAATERGFVLLGIDEGGNAALEERGLDGALRARIALGPLPVRDLAAVPGEDAVISFVSAGPTAASIVRADVRSGHLSILARDLPPDAAGRLGIDGRVLRSRVDGRARTTPALVLSDGSVVWWTFGAGITQRFSRDAVPLLPHRAGVELSLVGEQP